MSTVSPTCDAMPKVVFTGPPGWTIIVTTFDADGVEHEHIYAAEMQGMPRSMMDKHTTWEGGYTPDAHADLNRRRVANGMEPIGGHLDTGTNKGPSAIDFLILIIFLGAMACLVKEGVVFFKWLL